jgi:DNA polymerase-1
MELPLIGVLADIEARGILLDVALLGEISAEFAVRMSALVASIYEAAGCEFNVLSPIQLRDVLFTRLGLPTKGIKTTKTGASTDSDTLEALAPHHPLPGLVLESALAKLKSTYWTRYRSRTSAAVSTRSSIKR